MVLFEVGEASCDGWLSLGNTEHASGEKEMREGVRRKRDKTWGRERESLICVRARYTINHFPSSSPLSSNPPACYSHTHTYIFASGRRLAAMMKTSTQSERTRSATYSSRARTTGSSQLTSTGGRRSASTWRSASRYETAPPFPASLAPAKRRSTSTTLRLTGPCQRASKGSSTGQMPPFWR